MSATANEGQETVTVHTGTRDSHAADVREVEWGRDVISTTLNGYPCRMYRSRPRSLGELLQTRSRWAEREFLVQGTQRLSTADHEHAVAGVAKHLHGLGIHKQSRVFILGFNSIEWFVTFWALQALGAVPVLGNAWWSEHEVDAAVRQVKPALSIADRTVMGSPTISFSDITKAMTTALSNPDNELEFAPVDENSTGLIMFSSGTTGTARGVLMSHRSVIANIQNILAMTRRLPTELPDNHPGTVGLVTVPLFHIGGIQTSLSTMLSGGKLVFVDGKFAPAAVLELIQDERVTVWGSVPTMVSRVLEHPEIKTYDTSTLRSISMGGAPIHESLRSRIPTAFTGVQSRVGSLYGMTEAGGVLAAGSGSSLQSHPGSVGRALPVVDLRIDTPDPSGAGEILARTPTVIDGYLDDPRPISSQDGWIATGDLGYIDDDGWLFVTGRSKDVIIRGGENIAAAHVENAILSHPGVAEVAVVALPHPDLIEQVAAAVVVKPGFSLDTDELSAHAAVALARHELPSVWWLHPGPLPTNPTGKIVRREVREQWLERAGVTDIASEEEL